MNKAYQKLSSIFEEYYILGTINSNLNWDSQVKMPKLGYSTREKQLTLLHKMSDNLLCNNEVEDLINECNRASLSSTQARNFALMKNIITHQTCLPKKLKEEFNATSLKTEFIWGEAKANNDYKLFDKHFEPLIELLKEISTIKSEKLGLSLYETLLDQYDPGTTEQELDLVFSKLSKTLPDLIDKVTANKKNKLSFIDKKFTPNKQKKLFSKIIKKLGIQDSWCRIDESLHPFCTGSPGDVRITTRYNQHDFTSAMMGLIHESGHALYDSNLPKQTIYQPIGQAGGMAIHESQSLFFEMQIARSHAFSRFIVPMINKSFNLDLSATELYEQINHVEKSYIRVDADEATYPLHIILRYKIEKDLINGKLKTKDVPDAWNEKTQKLFHLPNPDHANGCLQDIHWSDGSLGYFPTYSLGAIYASQIASNMKEKITNWEEHIETGNFKDIRKFLKNNIHKYASQKTAGKIIEDLCGAKLDVDCYIAYLNNKYLK